MNGHSNGINGAGSHPSHDETAPSNEAAAMNSHSNGINGTGNHPSYDETAPTNGAASKANGRVNGTGIANGINGISHNGSSMTNGFAQADSHSRMNGAGDGRDRRPSQPVAICGMACRLPGGIHSPSELWTFLRDGQDARGPVPASRYNISAFHSAQQKPGSVAADHGYFLDSTNDLAALDTSFFSMSRSEVEALDPQQRLLLEVAHEALDDSGATDWRGSKVGVWVGSFGQDWYDISGRDTQAHGIHQVLGPHDFMVSNRLSHELDLRGPSVTIRTACSASLIGVQEACMAIARGDCTSAVVGGSSLLLAPALTASLTAQGVLSPDGSCNTFSANANGYARAEGIAAIYLKPLGDAIRDGNPVRAVITGSASNHSGHTSVVSAPSSDAQVEVIRQAYRNAGISDIARTGMFECHGTGTRVGDPIETAAVSACFGDAGVHIGSVKANLGHAEGAAGLVGILKAVLALENRTIPPSIKSLPRNPAIPFEDAKLIVPTEATPWPQDRDERASVSSFGLGGSNAHAIIESAASFNAARISEASGSVQNTPHLLLLSANTPASLKTLGEKYASYLARHPDQLCDVAYTLANKRQHFPYRAFSVCTSDNTTLAMPPASNKVSPDRQTSLVMVFTGQGAQWTRMGFELLRCKTNNVFKNTIESLDKALQALGPLAPSWTLDEELRKPARKSRVDEAEFSQPLCTALQIALVDLYASIGIRPAAVVGHSSGEIAAAYAAGGLNAREAIVVGYLRGLITTQQSRKGAMAALGMSCESAEKHLLPGVVIACDNAPNSVTVSGDAEPVEEMVKNIKQSTSGVLATQLKVEKAYHSHHMAEIGSAYLNSMLDAGVEGAVHTVPFFSSVSGDFFPPAAKSRFGPKYWQLNLERRVLFNSAVKAVLHKHTGPSEQVFLEVGPHAALAGPLRQILASNSCSAPYISTLARRTNSSESWLSALGQLFVQQVPFDLRALMPTGKAVSDMPTYPWDHHRSHWSESRISREWRMRKHPHHDLLGAKVLESTDLEPVWRNLLHIENAPWIRDHKINADIVFPFAGYIAMAAEAIRQITDVEEAVEFRNVAVRTALVVHEGSPTELVTSFHRLRLTDSLESEWWEFSIASNNGHAWTKHCSGEICARDESSVRRRDVVASQEDLPRKASSKRWYETFRRQGLDYGYHFESLKDITATTAGARNAHARVNNNWHGDEHFYHLHPVVLDSYFQLLSIAARYALTYDYDQVIPASVGSMTLHRCAADSLAVSANAELLGSGVCGTGAVFAADECVIEISNVRLTSFASGSGEEQAPITARNEWVPHIETQALSDLVKPSRDNTCHGASLDELVHLSVAACRESLAGLHVVPELTQHKAWLDERAMRLEDVDDASLTTRIQSLERSLASTPVAPIARAITMVTENAPAILSGQKKAFEVLDTDDTLGKIDRLTTDFNGSTFLNTLGLYKPNLRVLELCAGIGSATAGIITDLTRPDGQMLFSQYTVSDPSPGRVEALKTRFQSTPNMRFEVLEIAVDLESQGFDERHYDLIIAAGVLHSSPRLSESLTRAHQLLAPSGRLLLQSLRPGLAWSRYVLGMLPSWSIGVDDGRASEPYLDVSSWQKRLVKAGFTSNADHCFDSDEPNHMSHVIVARPQLDGLPTKTVTILSESSMESARSHAITQELLARGYDIAHCSLKDTPLPGRDIIALLDLATSFVAELDSVKLEQLKTFVDSIVDAGVLWITHSSQSHGADPSFGQIHGLARCIRSELDIALGVCEADDLESLQGCRAIVGAFQSFAERRNDGEIEPDFEYVVEKGVTRVSRFFPVASDGQTLPADSEKDARLTMDQPGRLDTLHWRGEIVKEPEGDEVQVEIHAAGLNFRDILIAMGIIESSPTFGYEATGIVRQVGPTARKLQVGDRVVLTGFDVFASTVTTTEKLCERLASDLDFNSAASMPLVFCTAIYSLINVGGLEKDQSVLIHSGCGGVGLAAIQLARMIGAEVYTTVSSEKKIKFLVREYDIPRDHIFNSRNVSFENDLLKRTNGRGVDLALNSLSGELLHATWRCVAKWGTLVEIGKRDLLGAGKLNLEVFLANRSYRCVDIDAMCKEKPEMVGRLLRSMMDFFREGLIHAIPIDKVFSGSRVREAFQHMQQGEHTGKIVLEFRQPTSGELQIGPIQPAGKPSSSLLDSSGSYLLVGGLGGLGRSVAVWMVQHGARHLTFLSRSAGCGQGDESFVRELESMGCQVQLVRGSVTNAADVRRAVAELPCPLKGVLQMTMVLRDQSWRKMSIDEWHETTAPKVEGTWNLHRETQSQDLDFLILFSSLSGTVGQPGQANYASANTFLDAFVRYRTSQGLPCTSLSVGAVEDAGHLTEDVELLKKMKGTGWRAVQESELLGVLGRVLKRSQRTGANGCGEGEEEQTPNPSLVDPNATLVGIAPVIPLSSPDSSATLRKDIRMSVFRNNRNQAKEGTSSDGLRQFLNTVKADPEALSKPESAVFLGKEIGKKLLGLVLRPVDDELDVSLTLAQLGLDSMVAVELRAWWKQMFRLDISTLEMLSMGTLEALGKHAAKGLLELHS